ncbi:MAG: YicC/YloC family endoribonuclease [Flavobacteriales bacterium]
MIRSMTGYGKGSGEYNGKIYSIEISSLNSKQFNFRADLPEGYKPKEGELIKLISEKIPRGKIDLFLKKEGREDKISSINKDKIIQYYQELRPIQDEINDRGNLLRSILNLPGVIGENEGNENNEENEWNFIKEKVEDAFEQLLAHTRVEGKSLEEDLRNNVKMILGSLEKIKEQEPEREKKVKEKLDNKLQEYLSKEDIDESRMQQELVYYLEKFDINEEKVRLENHCNYFLETINSDCPVGKKLSFISQEMLREINTIGSKANDSIIQHEVVQMKEHLEKVREQINNVL